MSRYRVRACAERTCQIPRAQLKLPAASDTGEKKIKKSRLCNLKLSHTGYCAPLQHETRQRCSFTSTWSSAPLTVSQYVRQLGLCYQLGHPLPEEEAEVDPGPDGSSLFKQLQATTAKSCSNNLVSVFCLTLQSSTTRLIKIVSNGRLELRCYGANC